MQDLCGLQGIYDLFNCKTPGDSRIFDLVVLDKEEKTCLIEMYVI